MAMGILPGPNIFLLANAARLYSLYQARQTYDFFSLNEIQYTPIDNDDLNWIKDKEDSDDSDDEISSDTIENIAKHFQKPQS